MHTKLLAVEVSQVHYNGSDVDDENEDDDDDEQDFLLL